MTRTRIHGTLEFQHQLTGKWEYRKVLFEADSEEPWTAIVDRAIEIASPGGDWFSTSNDLREEVEHD